MSGAPNVVSLSAYRGAIEAPPPGAPEPLNGPSLESYKRLFTESRDMTRISRLRSLLYRRYYDGDQWTEIGRAHV